MTRHLICCAHIDHTYKQIDNEPCHKSETRHVEAQEGGCINEAIPNNICKDKHENIWVFDHWPKSRSRMFVEPCGPLADGCLKGVFMLKEHTCGLGRGFKGAWRHMDVDGNLIGEAASKMLETGVNKGAAGVDMIETAGVKVATENNMIEEAAVKDVKGWDVDMF
ncbi:uncharacterized protein BP5553_05484 [Venustampulla echinocandica]|uniref:Uncharacterized protein n=1 Tax=Venustampulla echinocandica TaxID=2656787 RepID=A0A370TRB1_9HELO|nr:uncharacterized protein BP5553_05484 [Venustampulla echinocandica]RDL38051.1 hypothetical protein BP5553_05484 [Venustampulla echinocandica]